MNILETLGVFFETLVVKNEGETGGGPPHPTARGSGASPRSGAAALVVSSYDAAGDAR